MSVHKDKGKTLLLGARDLQALRHWCMRNCNADMIFIARWASEYLGKLLLDPNKFPETVLHEEEAINQVSTETLPSFLGLCSCQKDRKAAATCCVVK